MTTTSGYSPSLLFLPLLVAGCLDPLVEDDLGPSNAIFPAGTLIPNAHDITSFDAQLAANDGVGDTVPLLKAFSNQKRVLYWDFGAAPSFSAPLFVLVEKQGNELVPIDHNTIIDAIPGEAGYSPFWAVFLVPITDAYNGQLLTSFAAIDEAQALGLIEAPFFAREAVNCPIVARSVTVHADQLGNDMPRNEFYWRGQVVEYVDAGKVKLEQDENTVAESDMYVLRREGGEAINEVIRGVDITGDGDTHDTNNLFSADPDAELQTPLVRITSVAVPANTDAIDTLQDDEDSDFRSSTQLFNPDPIPGVVLSIQAQEQRRNYPFFTASVQQQGGE